MSILERYKQRQSEKVRHENKQKALDLYQLTEYNGEIWLTFNGCLVCPCSMLKDEAVDAVKKMRELYIKRHE